MPINRIALSSPELGVGFYTVPEASRLLRVPAINIRRWLGGYTFSRNGVRHSVPRLWEPQLPSYDGHMELGFRDLIELRFVSQFIREGLGLKTIRACMIAAREIVDDERPFSTKRFRTDGRTIFAEGLERELVHAAPSEKPILLDLKRKQYVFKSIIERSFRDLDFSNDIVARWRPFRGKSSIVIDPRRAFGQPIASNLGVPTISLAEAVKAEGSEKRVAYLFGGSIAAVRDAVKFEAELAAA